MWKKKYINPDINLSHIAFQLLSTNLGVNPAGENLYLNKAKLTGQFQKLFF